VLAQTPSRPTSRTILEPAIPQVQQPARLPTPTDGPNPFARFQRLLRKIEMANDQASSSRLVERWPEDDDDEDMMHEFDFETTLWALVRAQKLSYQNKQNDTVFPVPSGLDASDKEKFSGANILHLGSVIGESNPIPNPWLPWEAVSRDAWSNVDVVTGSAESWYLSTKYTEAIVHSLGTENLPFDLASSSWGLPPNLQLEQWSEFPRLDYVDAIFDVVIIAHHLFEKIKCTLWPLLIDEISRVLAPGGILIVSLMDALPRNSGPMHTVTPLRRSQCN